MTVAQNSSLQSYSSVTSSVPPAVTLRVQPSGANVVLTWTPAQGNLQSAPAVTGTYTNIPGATTGTYTVPHNQTRQFFRVKVN
jgi:hypothetical protein